MSAREVASRTGWSASTISRELRRNRVKQCYRHDEAQQLAEQRRRLASRRPHKLTEEVSAYVISCLQAGWSPEQTEGRLRREGRLPVISHESIYRMVWSDKHNGGVLYKHLRHKAKKYNKRSKQKVGRGIIEGRVDISQRPIGVAAKGRLGDWELDTVVSSKTNSAAVVSMVDRCSKLVRFVKVSAKTADAVSQAIINRLSERKCIVRTLTSDNGKEFAGHKKISKALGAAFYFATPYHSWERGLNEHTNGLLRQYFPKKTDFSTVTEKQLQHVENLLNNRPRSVLNFKTPNEVFYTALRFSPGVALQN